MTTKWIKKYAGNARGAVPAGMVAWAILLLAGCGGPNGLSIGMFGGSHGGGVGVGVGFPIGAASSSKEIPTAPAPTFKVGEVVAENDAYYRRFLGLTVRNGFVVQDFYKSSASSAKAVANTYADQKLTDAYVLLYADDVQGAMLPYAVSAGGSLNLDIVNWLFTLKADGTYVLWFANGEKALMANFKSGLLHGAWAQWYENGQRGVLGAYEQGEATGLWRLWYEDGRLKEEIDSGPPTAASSSEVTK